MLANLFVLHSLCHLCLAWRRIVRLDNLDSIPGQLRDLLRRPSCSLAELHTSRPERMKRAGTDPGLLAQGVEPVVCLPVLEGEEGVLPLGEGSDQHPDLLLEPWSERDHTDPIPLLPLQVGELVVVKVDVADLHTHQVTPPEA